MTARGGEIPHLGIWSRLQTASASFNGVEKFLLEETCDLPMQGDNFYVN